MSRVKAKDLDLDSLERAKGPKDTVGKVPTGDSKASMDRPKEHPKDSGNRDPKEGKELEIQAAILHLRRISRHHSMDNADCAGGLDTAKPIAQKLERDILGFVKNVGSRDIRENCAQKEVEKDRSIVWTITRIRTDLP